MPACALSTWYCASAQLIHSFHTISLERKENGKEKVRCAAEAFVSTHIKSFRYEIHLDPHETKRSCADHGQNDAFTLRKLLSSFHTLHLKLFS